MNFKMRKLSIEQIENEIAAKARNLKMKRKRRATTTEMMMSVSEEEQMRSESIEQLEKEIAMRQDARNAKNQRSKSLSVEYYYAMTSPVEGESIERADYSPAMSMSIELPEDSLERTTETPTRTKSDDHLEGSKDPVTGSSTKTDESSEEDLEIVQLKKQLKRKRSIHVPKELSPETSTDISPASCESLERLEFELEMKLLLEKLQRKRMSEWTDPIPPPVDYPDTDSLSKDSLSKYTPSKDSRSKYTSSKDSPSKDSHSKGSSSKGSPTKDSPSKSTTSKESHSDTESIQQLENSIMIQEMKERLSIKNDIVTKFEIPLSDDTIDELEIKIKIKRLEQQLDLERKKLLGPQPDVNEDAHKQPVITEDALEQQVASEDALEQQVTTDDAIEQQVVTDDESYVVKEGAPERRVSTEDTLIRKLSIGQLETELRLQEKYQATALTKMSVGMQPISQDSTDEVLNEFMSLQLQQQLKQKRLSQSSLTHLPTHVEDPIEDLENELRMIELKKQLTQKRRTSSGVQPLPIHSEDLSEDQVEDLEKEIEILSTAPESPTTNHELIAHLEDRIILTQLKSQLKRDREMSIASVQPDLPDEESTKSNTIEHLQNMIRIRQLEDQLKEEAYHMENKKRIKKLEEEIKRKKQQAALQSPTQGSVGSQDDGFKDKRQAAIRSPSQVSPEDRDVSKSPVLSRPSSDNVFGVKKTSSTKLREMVDGVSPQRLEDELRIEELEALLNRDRKIPVRKSVTDFTRPLSASERHSNDFINFQNKTRIIELEEELRLKILDEEQLASDLIEARQQKDHAYQLREESIAENKHRIQQLEELLEEQERKYLESGKREEMSPKMLRVAVKIEKNKVKIKHLESQLHVKRGTDPELEEERPRSRVFSATPSRRERSGSMNVVDNDTRIRQLEEQLSEKKQEVTTRQLDGQLDEYSSSIEDLDLDEDLQMMKELEDAVIIERIDMQDMDQSTLVGKLAEFKDGVKTIKMLEHKIKQRERQSNLHRQSVLRRERQSDLQQEKQSDLLEENPSDLQQEKLSEKPTSALASRERSANSPQKTVSFNLDEKSSAKSRLRRSSSMSVQYEDDMDDDDVQDDVPPGQENEESDVFIQQTVEAPTAQQMSSPASIVLTEFDENWTPERKTLHKMLRNKNKIRDLELKLEEKMRKMAVVESDGKMWENHTDDVAPMYNAVLSELEEDEIKIKELERLLNSDTKPEPRLSSSSRSSPHSKKGSMKGGKLKKGRKKERESDAHQVKIREKSAAVSDVSSTEHSMSSLSKIMILESQSSRRSVMSDDPALNDVLVISRADRVSRKNLSCELQEEQLKMIEKLEEQIREEDGDMSPVSGTSSVSLVSLNTLKSRSNELRMALIKKKMAKQRAMLQFDEDDEFYDIRGHISRLEIDARRFIPSVAEAPVSKHEDVQKIKTLENTVKQKEGRYASLMGRFKTVWDMCNSLRHQLDKVEQAVTRSRNANQYLGKEDDLITAIRSQIRLKTEVQDGDAEMTIAERQMNLQQLTKSSHSTKYQKHLKMLAKGLLNQSMAIPQQRFRQLIKRYIQHCAVKNAKGSLECVLQEYMSLEQRLDIMSYIEKMNMRYIQGHTEHSSIMSELTENRKNIFEKLWTTYNSLMTEDGNCLMIHSLMKRAGDDTEMPLAELRRPKFRYNKKRTPACGLVGRNICMGSEAPAGSIDPQPDSQLPTSRVVSIGPARRRKPTDSDLQTLQLQKHLVDKFSPAVTIPHILNLDVNSTRIKAHRNMQQIESGYYPLSPSRSYDILDDTRVEYVGNVLQRKAFM